MIARAWSARTTREQAPQYAEYLRTHVFAGLHALDGYQSAMLLERSAADLVEVEVITFWRSLESIRAFSGDDVEAAVVTERAASLLVRYDRRVRHYEVVLHDPVQRAG
jgi:heme-degrading monooxygenase HmoA